MIDEFLLEKFDKRMSSIDINANQMHSARVAIEIQGSPVASPIAHHSKKESNLVGGGLSVSPNRV